MRGAIESVAPEGEHGVLNHSVKFGRILQTADEVKARAGIPPDLPALVTIC